MAGARHRRRRAATPGRRLDTPLHQRAEPSVDPSPDQSAVASPELPTAAPADSPGAGASDGASDGVTNGSSNGVTDSPADTPTRVSRGADDRAVTAPVDQPSAQVRIDAPADPVTGPTVAPRTAPDDDAAPPPNGRPTGAPRDRGARGSRGGRRSSTVRRLLRDLPRRDRVDVAGGATLHLLVLAATAEDTTAVDLASGAVLRLRVDWPTEHGPDLAAFDVVEATLADDPQRDDLAQPEAASAVGLPRQVGTLRGRRVRRMLARLSAVPDGPLLGFPGPAAPYWDFRGARPSVALVEPTRGPQLLKRRTDGSTWVRFGWERDDVWLPVEDAHAIRALDAARRERLAGKDLAAALGFRPEYLLVTLTQPRDGHCYKVLSAILPEG